MRTMIRPWRFRRMLVGVALVALMAAVVDIVGARVTSRGHEAGHGVSQEVFEPQVRRRVEGILGARVHTTLCGRNSDVLWECFLTVTDGRKVTAVVAVEHEREIRAVRIVNAPRG